MHTLFDATTRDQLLTRLATLRPDSARVWGKMTPAQMLEHVRRVIEIPLSPERGQQLLIGKLIAWAMRSSFVGETPFRKNGPTGSAYVVADNPDFNAARDTLRARIEALHTAGPSSCEGQVHPFFGPLTGAEWGITQFKHLDHHLRQFGC